MKVIYKSMKKADKGGLKLTSIKLFFRRIKRMVCKKIFRQKYHPAIKSLNQKNKQTDKTCRPPGMWK